LTGFDEHPLLNMKDKDDLPKLFVTPAELANYWRMKPHTLANWRHQGIGPKFTKVGARILYSVTDLIEYEKTIDPGKR